MPGRRCLRARARCGAPTLLARPRARRWEVLTTYQDPALAWQTAYPCSQPSAWRSWAGVCGGRRGATRGWRPTPPIGYDAVSGRARAVQASAGRESGDSPWMRR
eukprot:scaffold142128_cov31-Tisochrysis_lutea.AAC.2